MRVERDEETGRLVLAVPTEQVEHLGEQLRAIALGSGDAFAATHVRRMLMQLRGQEPPYAIKARAADVLLVLEWGLREASALLSEILESDRPDLHAANAAYATVRWYLSGLSQVERLEMEELGITPELQEVEPEPIEDRRGRWARPLRTAEEREASDEPAVAAGPVAEARLTA